MKLQNQGKKEFVVYINDEKTIPLTWKQMQECVAYHQKINRMIENDIAIDANCPLKPSKIITVNINTGYSYSFDRFSVNVAEFL